MLEANIMESYYIVFYINDIKRIMQKASLYS